MRGLVAAFFAGGMLLGQQSVAAGQLRAIDFVGDGGVTPADPAMDFGWGGMLDGHSAMALAVNGRFVATREELGVSDAEGWNWTFLLLGVVGLVIANLGRRPVRRAVLSS